MKMSLRDICTCAAAAGFASVAVLQCCTDKGEPALEGYRRWYAALIWNLIVPFIDRSDRRMLALPIRPKGQGMVSSHLFASNLT